MVASTSSLGSPSHSPTRLAPASTPSAPLVASPTVLGALLRLGLAIAHSIVAIVAAIAGIALLRDPSGAPIGLGLTDLRGFETFATPGTFLLALAAVHALAAATVMLPGTRGLVASQVGGGMLTFFAMLCSVLIMPFGPCQLALLFSAAAMFVVAHELYGNEPHEHMLP
jgi:hypothetical protein